MPNLMNNISINNVCIFQIDVSDWSRNVQVYPLNQAMFRVIKESEYVDERQHCFLLQTVGRESRYFSMETRQELLRLESAWHRAVCQAVSTLEVSQQQCTLWQLQFF